MTNAKIDRVSTRAALWTATTIAFGALMVVTPAIAAADPGDGVDPSGTAGPSTSQSIVPRSLGEVPVGVTVRDSDKPVGTELVSPGTELNQPPPRISNSQPTTPAPRSEPGPTGPARSPLGDAFGDGNIPRSIINGFIVSPTLAGS